MVPGSKNELRFDIIFCGICFWKPQFSVSAKLRAVCGAGVHSVFHKLSSFLIV